MTNKISLCKIIHIIISLLVIGFIYILYKTTFLYNLSHTPSGEVTLGIFIFIMLIYILFDTYCSTKSKMLSKKRIDFTFFIGLITIMITGFIFTNENSNSEYRNAFNNIVTVSNIVDGEKEYCYKIKYKNMVEPEDLNYCIKEKDFSEKTIEKINKLKKERGVRNNKIIENNKLETIENKSNTDSLLEK